MSRKLPSLAARLALCALAVGFDSSGPGKPVDEPEDVPPIVVPAEDLKALAEGNNAFAIDLYKKLAEKDGNVFFSPYSISAALGMTYAGARGQTAKEMAKVLGIDKLGDKVHPAQAELARRLKSKGGKDKPECHVANALWAQKDMSLLPEFLGLMKRQYDGGCRELDFAGDTEGSRKTINGWVGEQTRDKIPELLKPGILKASTVLVLTNAIYFKGDWLCPFDAKKTRDGPFHRTPTDRVMVPMMTQTNEFRYFENKDVRLLELPYVGGFSMVLVLPKAAEDLDRIQKALAGGSLDRWLAEGIKCEMVLTMPKFRMRVYVDDLITPLKQLGMVSAFGDADFSGIAGARGLHITSVVHEAFIDVDEKGTVAAAATADSTTLSGKNQIQFRVDRPFLVTIRHSDTGCILFFGKVMDPAPRK